MFVQAYTLNSGVRPFGCSTIMGAVDKSGPALFVIEPSGVSFVCCHSVTLSPTHTDAAQGYHGAAVGKGRQLAKTELEKLKLAELSTREAAIEAARMYVLISHLSIFSSSYMNISIYLVHDDAKEKEFELEMSWISEESGGIHVPVPKDLFEEASRKAKESLENFE